MIQVVTTEGTFTIPGTAKDVNTENGALKITRDGNTIAHFRRWLHWLETPKEATTNV